MNHDVKVLGACAVRTIHDAHDSVACPGPRPDRILVLDPRYVPPRILAATLPNEDPCDMLAAASLSYVVLACSWVCS